MIGFKTIEDYSYDECIEFLNEHDEKDSSWADIEERYKYLLAKLQKEDDKAFRECVEAQDYKNYLSLFTNASGVTKYQLRHESEARSFLRKSQETSGFNGVNNKPKIFNGFEIIEDIIKYVGEVCLSIILAGILGYGLAWVIIWKDLGPYTFLAWFAGSLAAPLMCRKVMGFENRNAFIFIIAIASGTIFGYVFFRTLTSQNMGVNEDTRMILIISSAVAGAFMGIEKLK